MTETTETTTAGAEQAPAAKKRGGGINSMLLADLKSMASGMGIAGAGSMKKAQLIDAIKAAQSGGRPPAEPKQQPQQDQSKQEQPKQDQPKQEQPKQDQPKQDQPRAKQGQGNQNNQKNQQGKGQNQGGQNQPKQQPQQGKGNQNQGNQGNQNNQNNQNRQDQNPPQDQQAGADLDGDDDEGGRSRNRRRRGRDRDRTRARGDVDTTILEDDVLVPAAGILDVLENYAFVRTSGYLPGVDDVYVSLSMVRKYGLRRGDAVVGQVRQPREGERKEKFNPMVRIESVNGHEPDSARHRPDFTRLTPLYPSERLRLETGPSDVIGRLVDLAAPVGKGQRGLVVSPPRAGKTTVLQSIAASITQNNPECHLMVVLVDERPEEVTDFERSVKGEVIASTFDRPPADHTVLAELAIERAKRLVELGHDVVVLLDGLTRLARAYNLSASGSGRVLSGGVDSAALHPAKRFFGAARNIENGGSLTILATATVESGSRTDEVILEEFSGTGNMELRLGGDLVEHRLFPAVDAVRSGTRREELLLSEEELAILTRLRRGLARVSAPEALELLLERVRGTQTNYELLVQVQRGVPALPGEA